jgi:hypothetical protein
MSEYQYHEWQTVDRVLTPEEQVEVDSLSSHIEVSSSRAVVTYHWSNFRHDPKRVLLDYFDAYFYMANWGTLRLMFRFPRGLIDEEAIISYLLDRCRRIASVYNDATARLEKLEQLSKFQHTERTFQRRVRALAEKYANRPALIRRWKLQGWA